MPATGLVLAMSGSTAWAAGTTSGTTITNTVSVSYQVNGVAQTPISASDVFTVDRKINLTVAEDGTTTTTVTPGQQAAVTSFLVTNNSNAPIDLALAATQLAGGASPHGGTDNFDVTNVRIYADTNNNSSYDAGTDQLITYLDQVAADATSRVFVVVDVPLGRSTNDVSAVRLRAVAAEPTSAGSLGSNVAETTGANTTGVDTVFADTNANGNVARDGAHFAQDDYTVSSAALTVTKTSLVRSDPLNGTTNPKMIPGAVVEYCIAVGNTAGPDATNITITDALPAQTVFESTFGIRVNGTVTGSTCNADGTPGGSHSSGTVTATLSNVAAGVTRTAVFRVTVQ